MELNCPVCRTQTLEALTLRQETLHKCPSCHGIWFEGSELQDTEDLPMSDLMQSFQDQLDVAAPQENEVNQGERSCPRCDRILDRHQYDISSGINVDFCLAGHGVWLDRGEVMMIHKHLEDSARAMTPEKMAALQKQLDLIKVDENRRLDDALTSPYHHEAHGIMAPVWHAMDGVCRFMVHALDRLGL